MPRNWRPDRDKTEGVLRGVPAAGAETEVTSGASAAARVPKGGGRRKMRLFSANICSEQLSARGRTRKGRAPLVLNSVGDVFKSLMVTPLR